MTSAAAFWARAEFVNSIRSADLSADIINCDRQQFRVSEDLRSSGLVQVRELAERCFEIAYRVV